MVFVHGTRVFFYFLVFLLVAKIKKKTDDGRKSTVPFYCAGLICIQVKTTIF